jgi:hypothetical protein
MLPVLFQTGRVEAWGHRWQWPKAACQLINWKQKEPAEYGGHLASCVVRGERGVYLGIMSLFLPPSWVSPWGLQTHSDHGPVLSGLCSVLIFKLKTNRWQH